MKEYKKDYPLLEDCNLVYLDNAATTQKPYQVLQCEREYYERMNANPLRGFYDLGIEATRQYEEAREKVCQWIHAASAEEIIFTRNTTESINLVAYSYGLQNIRADDEILVTIEEHHSNLLPWQMVARQTGAKLKFLECEKDGTFQADKIKAAITPKTRLAAICHVSNVLGRINPVEDIIELVHQNHGVVLVDAAQSIPHIRIDVSMWNADFVAFSGHKMYAPMGIGVLYGRKALLESMPPFLTGGEMIDSVSRESAAYAPLPHKFEAGTVNAAGACGLAAAIAYIQDIGEEKIAVKERELMRHVFEEMRNIPHVHILGGDKPEDHIGILSFTIDGVHPHDIAAILNEEHIAIRAGHHCAQPLLDYLGVSVSARASLSFYNSQEDIDRFLCCLKTIRRKMGYGA